MRLTSSLVNADTKRILGLLIEDVRFTKDCIGSFDSRQTANSTLGEASGSTLIEKLLPTLTSFVQVQAACYRFNTISENNFVLSDSLCASR